MLAKVSKSLLLLLFVMVLSVPSFAGSAVIGSVAGSLNASLGGQALLPNTTIFSGDSLEVKNGGAAVVALENGSRIILGRNTVASFLTNGHEVTVVISQGNATVFHPNNRLGLEIKVGNISVKPTPGFKTLGDVAMVNGTVVVTAKEGTFRVEGNGPAVEVAQGKTITIAPKTARAPQAGGAQKLGGGSTALEAGALGAGAAAAILAGIAISRAGDAKDAANAANSTAAAAGSAAAAAASAAAAADSDAIAATSAAAAANANALAAGCAVNNLGADLGVSGVTVMVPSPFTPPTGVSCPPNPSGVN